MQEKEFKIKQFYIRMNTKFLINLFYKTNEICYLAKSNN